jgi:FOG: FHA domain
VKNQYVIIRDDLLIDPVTVITEGLLIGRLMECELLLNHPAVSRAQAGIKHIDDDYYLFPLRPNNPVTLNGKAVEGNEALAAGDVLFIGPFRLEIDDTEESLVIRVSLQIGMVASDVDSSSAIVTTDVLVIPVEGKKPAKPRAAPIAGTKALDIFWDKRIREAGKMVRRSPLFPKTQRRSGKAQFNWLATSDLRSRWSGSLFIWAALLVGLLSIAAAYSYTRAFVPAPLSNSHSVNVMSIVPAIASRPNAGSCTSCHSWKGKIDQRCAECHQTESFVATVIKPHEAAGIGCVECHAEHKGSDFKAGEAALTACTGCHNNGNTQVYNGKHVGTPHGGTDGYPVVDGVWNLKAVNDDEWELKKIPIVRLPTDTDEKWKSKQFHAIHSERVRVVPGIQGNALGHLSCSSCHKSFDPIDRATPRTTCATCHNGLVEGGTNRVLIASNQPNCTSCHVQHNKDKRSWGAKFLSQPAL